MSHSATQTRRSRPHRALNSIVSALPLLAVVLLVLAAVPAHAQERAAIRKVPPTYPALARQMGITGVVVVTATVDPTGKVVKVESNSGSKLLVPAALDAVKQWKFAPSDATDTFPVSISFEKN